MTNQASIPTLLAALLTAGVSFGMDFRRGDSNGDGLINIADPIHTLEYLYVGGPAPGCLDSADVNDDGAIDLADPIHFFSVIFAIGSQMNPLPAPQSCGADPSLDTLDCAAFPPCPSSDRR